MPSRCDGKDWLMRLPEDIDTQNAECCVVQAQDRQPGLTGQLGLRARGVFAPFAEELTKCYILSAKVLACSALVRQALWQCITATVLHAYKL